MKQFTAAWVLFSFCLQCILAPQSHAEDPSFYQTPEGTEKLLLAYFRAFNRPCRIEAGNPDGSSPLKSDFIREKLAQIRAQRISELPNPLFNAALQTLMTEYWIRPENRTAIEFLLPKIRVHIAQDLQDIREEDLAKDIVYDALMASAITALGIFLFKKVRPLVGSPTRNPIPPKTAPRLRAPLIPVPQTPALTRTLGILEKAGWIGRGLGNISERFHNVWEAKALLGRSALYGALLGTGEMAYDSLNGDKLDPFFLLASTQKRVAADIEEALSAWEMELGNFDSQLNSLEADKIPPPEILPRLDGIENHLTRIKYELSALDESAPQLRPQLTLLNEKLQTLALKTEELKIRLQ